ncbi:thiamine pyrophosphate-dependent enzyme [Carboxydothermus hydrogenoformans]|uniref:Putative keto/oxoacid ferredoxin oxidoreductase, beta subunit n=1 Tax=Carboxydothermus hydrogenoformans (strain ATCC BAA-161 / DSM 6008 / Z-2901) TaxID=246194 RepID=Q3AAP4_CARHZ|nr:thiamine pyrophosphate-dependent enzyme [Carboxydothermus hydrogenoformans]ABB15248.1 putative keto/oxoacid ferredoxin oxidoreductase, beta subunit [Carboxydothermus hydrogenoformans Z-2901]
MFKRPALLTEKNFHYCPGCHHGIMHRLLAEVLEEFNPEETIGVSSVGCSVFIYDYIDIDWVAAAHGRAPAVATGVKRVKPDRLVFTYQGDGDLAAIGTGEIVHAAARGEKITAIFINNAVYGMTGGQMAPTTLTGQKTTTTPEGRNPAHQGYPVKMVEMLSVLDGVAYAARVALNTPKRILEAKKALRKAFKVQRANLGFSIIEVLSACPTNWGVSPVEALKWVDEKMIAYYPLGEYKTPQEGVE